MSRRRVAIAICAVLGLTAAALAVRVLDQLPTARVELTRTSRFTVDQTVRQRLRSIDDQAFITLYISARHRMPSHLRRLERDIVDVLDAMAEASGGRLAYQVLDPDQDEPVAHRAARRRAAPARVRSVRRDGHSERTVWSSLSIAYGPYPPAVINGLGAEDVPRLQSLILAQIDQMARPRKPAIAVAAPPEYTALRASLARRGALIDVDLDGGEVFPAHADVLFWMDPQHVSPARLREIDDFLAVGRSIVVAHSGQRVVPAGAGDSPAVRFDRRDAALAPLLSAYGLRAVRGLVVDRFSDAFEWNGVAYPAPFVVRCMVQNQDFRWMRRALNAPLLFTAPTPLAEQGGGHARAGWTVDVLASTSEETRLLPLPEDAVPLAPPGNALAPGGEGEPAPKLALVTMLRPEDPRRGSLLFFAATTPFEDRTYTRFGTGHARLVDVLLETLASDQQLVSIGAASAGATASLRDLEAGGRLFWRIAVLAPLPALLLLLSVVRVRGATRPRRPLPAPQLRPAARPRPMPQAHLAALGAAGVAAVGALSFVLGAVPGRADLTADRLNELAPESRRIAQASAAAGPVTAELIFSDRRRLPPQLRRPVARVEQVLDALRRAGAPVQVSTLHPEDLPAGERAALEASGITPVEIAERDADVTTVRRIYSAVRLHRGGREEVLPFPDEAAFENVEFRLAFALWRIETGSRPHVAIASDVPRLTPAEAHELFQKQGLTAPQSADVYSLARQVVARHDFRVTHVNPRAPSVPADADLLVWFQPRPPMEPMMQAMTEFLHAGRPVILAAQHFNMQARQYPGRGNAIVYWPQPQWPELHTTYFPELGIHMDRVVLFDELNTTVSAEAQRYRGTLREFDEQPSSLPFVIRAAAANFTPSSAITRGVGDQVFVWGNYIRLDAPRLREMGLQATVLMTTSPLAWSFAWEGGFLPEEVLTGPLPDSTGRVSYLGRMPLSVLFEGRFPLWNVPPERPPVFPGDVPAASPETEAYEPLDLASLDTARPTRLLMIGGSELFKDDRLLDMRFRADHLLLGAVATLAAGDELGAVAGRRPVPRGFDYVPPSHRLVWRGVVLGTALGLLLLFGAVWTVARRRPPSIYRVRAGSSAVAQTGG